MEKKLLVLLLSLGISFFGKSQRLPWFIITRANIEPVNLKMDSIRPQDMLPGVLAWGKLIVGNGTLTEVPNKGIQINGTMESAFAAKSHLYDVDISILIEVLGKNLKLMMETNQVWQRKGNTKREKVDLTYHDFFKENGEVLGSYKNSKIELERSLSAIVESLYNYLNQKWTPKLQQTRFEKGYMSNTEKIGVWQYYNNKRQVELVIDHSNGRVKYLIPDTSKYPVDTGGKEWIWTRVDVQPIPVRGFHSFYESIEETPYFNIEGCQSMKSSNVVVSFVIDTLGKLITPRIEMGLDNACGSTVINSFERLNSEWLSAQIGKTKVPVRLAVNLAFRNGNDTVYSDARPNSSKLIGEVVINNALKDKRVFTFVEESAEPIGGLQGFYAWIGKNLQYPGNVRRQGIQGKVFVKFVVERSGEITNIEVVKGFNEECDKEAIRVISKSPKWKPGKQRGIPVRQAYTLPITFQVK